jgi:hypothetical protein
MFDKNGVLLVAILVAASGCSSKTTLPANDPSMQALAASAERVDQSFKQLAQSEQFEKITQRGRYLKTYPSIPGLDWKVSLPWYGPIEPLVQKIVSMGNGYTLQVVGKRPSISIDVSLDDAPRPLAVILQNAGLQAGNRADIAIDRAHKIIQLRYVSDGI